MMSVPICKSGWFSCRSACYLASARPVVVQDTGFTEVIKSGEGLIAFDNLDQALAGIESVRENYQHHSEAARAVAEKYFESSVVLEDLLNNAMSTSCLSGAA